MDRRRQSVKDIIEIKIMDRLKAMIILRSRVDNEKVPASRWRVLRKRNL